MRLKADPKSKNLASEESIFARAVPRWSERSDFFRFPAQIRAFYVFSASLFSCCRPVTDVTAPPPPFVDGPGRFVDRTKVRAEEHLLEPGNTTCLSHFCSIAPLPTQKEYCSQETGRDRDGLIHTDTLTFFLH